MLAENKSAYDYSMTTKYVCKELIVKSFFDPILSSEMNEFLYNYLNRKKAIKVLSFSFNDDLFSCLYWRFFFRRFLL